MPADFTRFGLAIGHATDDAGGTGLTVIRGIDTPFRAAATVLGRATGTRELDALAPSHLVDRIDAVLLTGGSAYGLGAADGVMRWMEERGRGFPVAVGVVPIVPAAVVFDLAPCGIPAARPTPAMAYEACERATPVVDAEGSVGAGTGTTVGKLGAVARPMKGGIGAWVEQGAGVSVGAIAVVNALGDVRDGDGRIIAGARSDDGTFLDIARTVSAGGPPAPRVGGALQNTTLAFVVTDALLSRVELAQLSKAAGAALARRITPVGTTYDGDVIFAAGPMTGEPAPLLQVESLAVRALEMAIERAVRTARGRDGIAGLADV
ncbi:MAG: P1 family peptidase [Gemmatimonadaceae bacterium]